MFLTLREKDMTPESKFKDSMTGSGRPLLILIIAGFAFTSLGYFLYIFSESSGLELLVGRYDVIGLFAILLILSGLFVIFSQMPRLLKTFKTKNQLEKQYSERTFDTEIKELEG